MPDTIETRVGTCPSHGTVRAERRVPRPSFPFVIYGLRRLVASTRPYRCPECGTSVSAG
jgi:hypothetical protein